MEFDATIRKSFDERIHVTAPDDVRFFWLFGVPYVVGDPPGGLATLDEAARAGIITVTVI